MPARPSRGFAAGFALVASLTRAPRAAAAEPTAFEFDCWAISERERSIIEARARATLSVKNRHGGRVTIRCDRASVTVEWREGEATRSRTLPFPARAEELPDTLLMVIDELTDAPAAPVQREEAPARGVLTSPHPPPSPPAPRPAVAEAPRADPAGAAPARQPVSLWVVAGGVGEIWSTPAAVAAGPRAGLRLELDGGPKIELGGAYRWVAPAPDPFSITVIDLSLGADVPLVSSGAVSAGAGLAASLVTAEAAPPIGPAAQRSSFPALWARVRYHSPWRAVRVALGPEMRVHLGAPSIALDEAEIFRVPVIAAGFGVDLGLSLLGGP